MNEQHVTLPGGWSVPKDQFWGGATEKSQFDNGDVISGEIVEEGV
jgi:hypothetical protein